MFSFLHLSSPGRRHSSRLSGECRAASCPRCRSCAWVLHLTLACSRCLVKNSLPRQEALRHFLTHFFSCRTAASTFKDFELASVQQRPDTVLRQRFRERLRGEERTKSILTKPRTNRFVKLAVMGLTVALGAAALAVVKSALEWAPKFELQIFP